jgi:hypothetical protein
MNQLPHPRLLSMVIAGLVSSMIMLSSAVFTIPQPVSAEAGACSTQTMCLAKSTYGNGQLYQFAVDDPKLNNNDYADGSQVSDNNRSVRDRKSTTYQVCVYQDFNYSGTVVGHALWDGDGWVNTINRFGSSIRFRFSISCA